MIIRTTWGSRLDYLAQHTNRIATEMSTVSDKITTGLEVSRPSDAPELTTRIQNIERELSDQARFAEDAEYANNLLSVSDSVLNELAVVVSRARELAVQMGSETYQGPQRVSSAELADQLLEQARGLLNSQMAGRYLFSGEAYDTQPYADDLSYQGATDPSEIQVSDTVGVTVGFNGEDLELGSILTAIEALREALKTDDAGNVLATLDELIASSDTVSSAQTVVGIEQSTADDFQALAKNMGVELEVQYSNMVDADAVESIMRLGELQTQYDAVLAVISKTQMSGLFERI